jgi:hypothetical protein
MEVPVIGPGNADYLGADAARVALGFDLSLPLGEQLERTRQKLGALKAARRRAGVLMPRSIASLRERWTGYLRILDAEAAGVDAREALAVLQVEGLSLAEADLSELRQLCASGYRQIVSLPAGE